jgi:DinB superfamily
MRTPSPDPVADPSGYQRHILSLLGDDDPAKVQSGTPAALRTLVAEAGRGLRTRPEPGEWSVLECVGHIVDAEIVSTARYRWIVAHEEPQLIGYDEDLWVERLHHADDDAGRLLTLFETLRDANLEMWARATDGERARAGIHAERGRETYDLIFRLLAGHDRFHVTQARRTLDAVRI